MSALALVVDDHDLVRMTTSMMLRETGYDVTEANSGESALALLAGGCRPTLVVTDHVMTGMSGADLAWHLHSDLPAVKVLVVSGFTEHMDLPDGVPILAKPFRKQQLASCLSLLLPE